MAERAEHSGHQKMFADMRQDDKLTTWERFEQIASQAFSVRKEDINAHKPIRKKGARKTKPPKS
jgi:hypothetical protein